jgi:hypothetical protein
VLRLDVVVDRLHSALLHFDEHFIKIKSSGLKLLRARKSCAK